ncbi:MAG TPA: hypothetical protein VF485_14315, partial [Sphingomonas sp.]
MSRSRRSSIIAQFGSDRADLLQWALTTGDPLADAVVIAMHADPEVRGQPPGAIQSNGRRTSIATSR